MMLSSLAHYTEFLAVEQAGAMVKEIPLNNNIVHAEAAAQKIEEIKYLWNFTSKKEGDEHEDSYPPDG